MTGLLSRWVIADPQTVAGLLVLAALGVVLVRVVRRHVRARRRRQIAVVLAVATTIVFSAAGVADAVNVHFAYLPRMADLISGSWPHVPAGALPRSGSAVEPDVAHRFPSGGVVAVPVDGTLTGPGVSHALAYLPPQYFTEPSRRFPVVYLLHGSPGVPADWLRGGRLVDAAAHAADTGHPVIVVMPHASRSWLDDSECVDGLHERSQSYLTGDVVRSVDARLRTIPDRAHRAVAGMSAGGYCALNLGLRHRDEFSAIVDMSGLDRPTHEGGLDDLYGNGPVATARARADTPADYAATLPADPPTAVWLDCGTADGAPLTATLAMAKVLGSRGFETQLHLRPGTHTFHVWVPALREALPWLADRLSAPTPAAPSSRAG